MRRRLVSLLMAVAVSACAGAQPPASPASVGTALPVAGTSHPATSAEAAQPTVACLGGVSSATCDEAARIALAAVASSGWTPTQVWVSSGSLCPSQACLFDPNQNYPYPMPPTGGQWVGNAEIAFAQTDKHAGLNIAAVGASLVPVLIGYRVPLLTWCSGSCPSSAVTEGRFRLELVLPHLAWKTTDAISGMAILSLTSGPATTVYGSGGSVIAFSYDEVGGSRHTGYVMTADCASHPLDPATPLTSTLSTSGAVAGTEPDAEFLRAFLADPQIHLPAGTWDITAIAVFSEVASCAGETHTMRVTERVTVSG